MGGFELAWTVYHLGHVGAGDGEECVRGALSWRFSQGRRISGSAISHLESERLIMHLY